MTQNVDKARGWVGVLTAFPHDRPKWPSGLSLTCSVHYILPGPFQGLGHSLLSHKHYAQKLSTTVLSVRCRQASAAHTARSQQNTSIKPGCVVIALQSLLAVDGLPQTWHHQGLITHHQGLGLLAW